MKNALIFSPALDGHRQVHVFVMSYILEKSGFKIFIAGNLKEKISNSFYIENLKRRPEITFLDTSLYENGGVDITLKEFVQMQIHCNADLTIFAEGDHHFPLFIAQLFNKKKKLRGRVVSVFMRPYIFYRKNNFIKNLKFIKHFFSRWKIDEQLFYNFLLKNFSLLDVAITLDENLAAHNPQFKWVPDIYQKYVESIIDPGEPTVQEFWIEKLNEFKEQNKSRFRFLYFGTSQFRRGYDILLKLADETDGCFIHCGLRDNNVEHIYDINKIISKLKDEGRYFETNEYIKDPDCIGSFFKSATHLILPYRDFLGSSGVLLQALENRLPVLVPETGIIGYRVKKHNLGFTFVDSNMDSLFEKFTSFKDTDPKVFEKNIAEFMDLHSIQQFENAMTNAFINSELPVILP